MDLSTHHLVLRNASIIRAINKKIALGVGKRVAMKQLAAESKGISYSVIDGVMHTKAYPYAKEAWEIVNKESNEAETANVEKNATQEVA